MTWFKNQRILVPFDFTDECVEAVRVGLELATSNDDVHVLHVLVTLPEGHPYAIWVDDADEQRKTKVREAMEAKLAHLKVNNVHLDVGIGNAGDTVAALAKEIDAGLIVIPCHGRTGLKRLFLGSVAERVVRLAPCPVLVLKDDAETSE